MGEVRRMIAEAAKDRQWYAVQARLTRIHGSTQQVKDAMAALRRAGHAVQFRDGRKVDGGTTGYLWRTRGGVVRG